MYAMERRRYGDEGGGRDDGHPAIYASVRSISDQRMFKT
jgi:hypothetical protein